MQIKITTGKPPIGKATIAYKFGTGAYKNMGPTFGEIYGLTPENRLIGLYYDNPDHVSCYKCKLNLLMEKVRGDCNLNHLIKYRTFAPKRMFESFSNIIYNHNELNRILIDIDFRVFLQLAAFVRIEYCDQR